MMRPYIAELEVHLELDNCGVGLEHSVSIAAAETSSMQVREMKADRWIPAVVGVGDHLGTAAREAFGAA
jgi:hypothetical protein